MTCPNCNYTMHGIGHGKQYCPICGTLRQENGAVIVPALVGHCREFEAILMPPPRNEFYWGEWHRLGIAECTGRRRPPER